MSVEFYEEIARLLRHGRRLAVATVIETAGSTPRKEGARMAVLEDGSIVDTVGGGAFEALVIDDAKALLSTGGTAVKEYFFREGDAPASTGMVCGGRARVHLQVEVPPERFLIFGAGHVGRALAALAGGLGFAVSVLDDREEFLDPRHFPPGATLLHTGPDFSGDLPPIDAATYIAVVTRCHRTDVAALRRVASGPALYVGLIGSRRKVRVVMTRLAEEGMPPAALDRVRAPIGVPIGACTPGEIAVSIAAEVIRIRRSFASAPSGLASLPAPRSAERHHTRPVPAPVTPRGRGSG